MHEEMNMIRKVKAYLHRLKILEDENALHEMSLVCEIGNSGGGGSVTKTTLKKPSSPTLSTTSSTASESRIAKFGSNSPHSYQKLLALSEPSLNKNNKKIPPVPVFSNNKECTGSMSSIVSGELFSVFKQIVVNYRLIFLIFPLQVVQLKAFQRVNKKL